MACLHSSTSLTFQTVTVLPWSLLPSDSSQPWSPGLFRFFDICCSLFEWLICPPLNRYLLITWDTFNRQGIKHIQQSGGSEKKKANKSQSHSFRSLLYVCPFQRAVCAKLPCGGQPSIWRGTEAWSRSALEFPSYSEKMCLHGQSGGLFLLTNAKYLQLKWFVDHVRRGLCLEAAQMEITHWTQLVDPRLREVKK